MPKRINGLHTRICSIENVELADDKARKHKTKNYGVRKHDLNRKAENQILQKLLSNLTYKTSKYSTFKIYEPKEREIFRLPYWPDRIAHHSIMNITEEIWVKTFIEQTYSCIKHRGIHKLCNDLKRDLKKYPEKTVYCLKLDIKKFYPSLDHEVLKLIVRRKIKDKYALVLMDEIIDSAPGVPIGNYLSQFFANLYLSYFDHWLKEEVKCRFYYRYADDIVILSDSKEFLQKVLILIKMYLHHVLKLEIKPNYQIYPVESRGIDFVGYVFYHTHTGLRKSLKKNMMKMVSKYTRKKMSKENFVKSISSYKGWLKYCDSRHLANLIQKKTGFRLSNWDGVLVPITQFDGKYVHIVEVINHKRYYEIHCLRGGKSYTIRTNNQDLWYSIHRYKFPVSFKIITNVRSKKNRVYHQAFSN